MHALNIPSPSSPTSALGLALRQARRLHRAAQSGPLLQALPALRRVHAAGVLPGMGISALYRQRHVLRRKHFLRTLAIEAGYADWESWRPVLVTMLPQALDHFRLETEWNVHLNSWFSSPQEATEFARQHGGRVLRVGRQAAVLNADVASEVRHVT